MTDLEGTLNSFKQNTNLLCQNLNLFCEYSEGKKYIDFNVSIEGIVKENMRDALISLFMNCHWLVRNGIDLDFYTYLKEHIVLAEIDPLGDLSISSKKYDKYLFDRITEYPKIDKIYLDIQNLIIGIKTIDEKDKTAKIKRVFQLYTEMLSEIYSKFGKEFNLRIQIRIQKKKIENAMLNEIPEIKEYINLGFWLKEEGFLEYLDCKKIEIPERIEYFSNGRKIPFIIIPESTLELKSMFFYILSSWKEASRMDISEFRHQHKDLLKLYDRAEGKFPPSVLLQDEVLSFILVQDMRVEPRLSGGFWKLLIYSIFHTIADEFEDKAKMQFRFNYGFKKKVIDLRSEEGSSLLELPKKRTENQNLEQNQNITENRNLIDILSSLTLFNDEYTKSLEVSSLKKGWKIAFNEVLGFNMYEFIDADNIRRIVNLYKKTVEKAFSDELERLTDLMTTVEKSSLDIIDQIAKTINSISSEVHNSTIAVFGSLLVEILVVLSGKEEKLVWELGILLIFQFIVFYIPMVNRKINGLVHSLLDTREVYEKSVDNTFKIMDLPDSDVFSKVRDFRENVNSQWFRFEESAFKEITFSRWLSGGLFLLLLLLISAKPKAPNNIVDFLIKNDVTFDNLRGVVSENQGDFLIVLTPIMVLIMILLFRFAWVRRTKKTLLEKSSGYSFEVGEKLSERCSIYSSDYVLISFFILYILFLLNDIFKLLN